MSINVDLIKKLRAAIQDSDVNQINNIFQTEPEILHQKTVFGTWLHDAALQDKYEVVKYLIEKGINCNEKGGALGGNALSHIASKGNTKIADFLIASGSMLDTSDPQHNPLFGAIYGGKTDMAKLLINSGIDISVKYSGERMKGMDALAYAEERGELEIAELIRAELAKREKS